MRIVFMGTPDFAVPTLAALIASPYEVVAVYCQPPRPAGRGLKLQPSPVQKLAEASGIPVYTPTSLKSAEAQTTFAAHRADIGVVAAYGLLLPQAILAAPLRGCINIHPSDLPRWRGAAPLQRTLMAGDTHTACCIMQMDVGLDTGAVLIREPYVIPAAMDAAGLQTVMAEKGATHVLSVLNAWANGKPLPAIPQAATGVTYANKITKSTRILDWSREAVALQHQVRGLSPSPAAITELNGEIIKIFNGVVARGDATQPPGTVLDGLLRINAGNGTALQLTELQRPGKARQSSTQFLQGFPVLAGTIAKNPI